MLLSFSVENWMSYQNEAVLSLVASRERQHGETLFKIPGFRSKKALPLAAVYGGNASGKTALFKALQALRNMVTSDCGVDGTLPATPFELDEDSAATPTSFDLTFVAGSRVYRLIVEASVLQVHYECLQILAEHSEQTVYERDEARADTYSFNTEYFGDLTHTMYAARSTRSNQLFLQSAVAQNVKELEEPYRWFSNTLELVGVQSQSWSFARAAGAADDFLTFAGKTLARLDTGIVGILGEEVGQGIIPTDAQLKKAIAGLDDDHAINIVMHEAPGDYRFELINVRKINGAVVARRLRTEHVGPDGKRRLFTLSMESSGTQRLLGLLPMLYDFAQGNGKVYVVDELDRCLHTMLTKQLIEDFASSCNAGTCKQLLFTTHDLLLMDQRLMRRDEMYIAQRNAVGQSELIGLDEFKDIRYDKDLIRSYLDGRFGGVPMFEKGEACGSEK